MCLDRVDKIFEPNDRMVVGYKVFCRERGRNRVGNECKNYKYTVGKNYTAPNKGRRIIGGGLYYPAGYHIFASIKDAQRWITYKDGTREPDKYIYEVHGWSIRAKGVQDEAFGNLHGFSRHLKIVIAENMRIIGPAE